MAPPNQPVESGGSGQQEIKAAGKSAASDTQQPLLATSAACTIRIDNKEIKHDVSSIHLEQFTDKHHNLRIRLRQVGKATSSGDFDDPSTYTDFLGKSVSVIIKPSGGLVDASRELEFIGTVTGVSLDNSIDGINTVLISGQSPTISMDGARRNAFFADKTAGEIIGSILRNYPVTLGNVESTSGTLKFVVQYRETDYDFIMRLAGQSGKFAFYDGKEFCLVKASSGDIQELVWRETLGSFAFGLGTWSSEFASQIYNYEQKKDYSQDTKSLSQQSALSAMSKLSPDASKNIFTASGFAIPTRVVADSQSLDEMLVAKKNGSLGRMIKCLGLSIVPKLAVGHCVKIKGMDKFDGTFWVNSVTHVFDESGKYYNTFESTPLDMAFPIVKYRRYPVTDLQSSVVLDNNDPEKMGRIKVKFVWAQSSETPWIRYVSLHAGKSRGWYCLPEVADEVLVGYENGNPDLPIAFGSLYNKDDNPHADTNNDKNDIKMFITKGGNQIYFKDESGSEQIKIAMKDGKNVILMDLNGPKISIESQSGDISIKAKNVTIECDEKFDVKTSTGDINLKSGGNLNAEGSMNAKIKGGANANVEGGAMVEVKGSMIKLN